MKRIISLILVSLLSLSALFCLAGCGAVNKGEVAVLWSGESVATNPNTLINCMDRAMYIENIKCTYYSALYVDKEEKEKAEDPASNQVIQANDAIEAGCQVLLVELVTEKRTQEQIADAAKQIADAAKAESIPVVFFNCDVDVSALDYDKCYVIKSNNETIADAQGKLIADYVKANYKDIDKDGNREILAHNYKGNDLAEKAVNKANELLATDDYEISTFPIFGEKFHLTVKYTTDTELLKSELILTDNDEQALNALLELQKEDYNTNQLVDKFIPIVTVGEDVDYKKLVVDGDGEFNIGDFTISGRHDYISEDDKIKEDDDQKTIDEKNEKFKNNKELQDYYKDHKYLVDLTSVKESDLIEMIYTTLNVIDAGRLAGSAIEDKDAMAAAVAKIVKNLCQGNDFAKDVTVEDSVVVDGNTVKVSYTTYSK